MHKKSHRDEPNGDYYLKTELMPAADAKAMFNKDNTFCNIYVQFLNSDVNLIFFSEYPNIFQTFIFPVPINLFE